MLQKRAACRTSRVKGKLLSLQFPPPRSLPEFLHHHTWMTQFTRTKHGAIQCHKVGQVYTQESLQVFGSSEVLDAKLRTGWTSEKRYSSCAKTQVL